MSKMVVGVYESRRDADAVRERLIEYGVDAGRIAIEDGSLRDGKCVLSVRTNGEDETRIATSLLARAGPRVYSLSNAPSAWHEATAGDPASMAGVDRDPGRPEGLLDGAEGLPAASDRTRLSAPRTR
jgi:hypothetical protein